VGHLEQRHRAGTPTDRPETTASKNGKRLAVGARNIVGVAPAGASRGRHRR
jgi:hypothetical protein